VFDDADAVSHHPIDSHVPLAGCQSADHRLVNVVRPGYLGQSFPGITQCNVFLSLELSAVRSQWLRKPPVHPTV
jgi:hypothetical protein